MLWTYMAFFIVFSLCFLFLFFFEDTLRRGFVAGKYFKIRISLIMSMEL